MTIEGPGLPAEDESTTMRVLALLRLDPAMHHRHEDFAGIRNAKVVWEGVLPAEKALPKPSIGPIYPLPAAATAAESARKLQGGFARREEILSSMVVSESPRDRFAQNWQFENVGRFMELSRAEE
jgi:hypothetical protein